MVKEPVKREVEQEPPTPESGVHHGLTPQQIKVIEDARGEPQLPVPKEEETKDKRKDKEEGRHDKLDK